MLGQSLATLYPAFGVNFKPKGMILPDLQRYDMLAIYELPKTATILNTAEDWIIDNFCLETPDPDPFEKDLCETLRPMIQYMYDKTKRIKRSISHKLERDLIDILPDLSSNRGRTPENRFKQIKKEIDFSDIEKVRKSKEYLQAIETLEKTSKSLAEQKRKQIRDVKENISKDKEFMDRVLDEYMTRSGNSTGSDHNRSKRSVRLSLHQRFASVKYRQFRDIILEKFPSISQNTGEIAKTWEIPEKIAISVDPEGYQIQNCNGDVGGSAFTFRINPTKENQESRICMELCRNLDEFLIIECFIDCMHGIHNHTWEEDSTDTQSTAEYVFTTKTHSVDTSTENPIINSTSSSTINPEFSQIVGEIARQPGNETQIPMCMNQSDIQLLLTHEAEDIKTIRNMHDLATARNWTSPKQLGRALRLWPHISKIDPDLVYSVDLPGAQEVEQCRGTLLGRQVGTVDSECYSCATFKCLTVLYLLHTYELRHQQTPSELAEGSAILQDLEDRLKNINQPKSCKAVCPTKGNVNTILKFFAEGQLTDLKRSIQKVALREKNKRQKRSIVEGLIQMSPGYNILQALFGTSDNTQEINSNFQQIAEAIDNMSQDQIDLQDQLTTLVKVSAENDEKLFNLTTQNSKRLVSQALAINDLITGQGQTNSRLKKLGNAIGLVAYVVGTIQPWMLKQIDILEAAEQVVDDLLNSVDALAAGRLTHSIVSPYTLTCMIEHVNKQVKKQLPGYKLAMPEVSTYFDIKMIKFAAETGRILIHIPIYLKRDLNTAFRLYQLESVALPTDDLRMTSESSWTGTYTKIEFSKQYFAEAHGQAMMFSTHDLEACMKFGEVYYCETPSLVTFTPEHNCAYSVFKNNPRMVDEKCDVKVMTNHSPSPTILSSEEQVLVVGMPPPWNARCPHAVGMQ